MAPNAAWCFWLVYSVPRPQIGIAVGSWARTCFRPLLERWRVSASTHPPLQWGLAGVLEWECSLHTHQSRQKGVAAIPPVETIDLCWKESRHEGLLPLPQRLKVLLCWKEGSIWKTVRDFVVAQVVKNLPTMQETQVQSLGQEGSLEKVMATHSSTLVWGIPWTDDFAGYSPRDRKESDTTVWLSLCIIQQHPVTCCTPMPRGCSLVFCSAFSLSSEQPLEACGKELGVKTRLVLGPQSIPHWYASLRLVFKNLSKF